MQTLCRLLVNANHKILFILRTLLCTKKRAWQMRCQQNR